MTSLNEVANMELNAERVFPNRAAVGSGIFSWLNSAVQRVRDILDVDLDEWVTTGGEDEAYFSTGGCCGF